MTAVLIVSLWAVAAALGGVYLAWPELPRGKHSKT